MYEVGGRLRGRILDSMADPTRERGEAVPRPPQAPTAAEFVLDQIFEAGVDTIFGIPGDFILRLCKVIEDDPRFRFLTLSHEPGVGFAACGAARGAQGLGVACVTYGAGALNMINPVAAAYAEKTPLLVLTGGPGAEERSSGILVHHQVKEFDSQLKVFREVTHYQAVLDDPETVADQVRYAIDVCRLYSLPVYLELPRDMIDRRVSISQPIRLTVPTDHAAVAEAVEEIVSRLSAASRPVLVVGVEVHRQGLQAELVHLSEELKIPVVSTFMGRGSFPADHPQYRGSYLGPASPPGVRELVEESDILLMLGVLLADTNMGVRLTALDPRGLVCAVSRRVQIGHHRYLDVPLPDLVSRLADAAGTTSLSFELPSPLEATGFSAAGSEPSSRRIRVEEMIAEINYSFDREGPMPLVTDTGDCLFCSHEIDTGLVLASAYYATMGFGVPAGMGWAATGGDRPLILVGDGGFQMTGWELLHAARWNIAPVVVLMNNGSWEMLQSFLPAAYNELAPGGYIEVAKAWGIEAWRAATAAELRLALLGAREHDGTALIEVELEPGDISKTLSAFTRSVGTTPAPDETP